jgi:hypothetical protein
MQPTVTEPETVTALAAAPTAAPPAPPSLDRRISIDQLAALGPIAADDRRITWLNTLVEADAYRQSYATDKALARDFAICGKFDDLKDATPEQAVATAMVKIQLGRAWGFNAADSIKNIYFVNGKPALEQDIVASKLSQAGIAWDVDFAYDDVPASKGSRTWRKCVGCTLWLKHVVDGKYAPMLDRKGEQISVSFTLADAENAKYYEKGQVKPLADKFNYQSYPSDMYYWRCISRVRKYYAPSVLRGGVLREEALEAVPADMPPDPMPRELPEPAMLKPSTLRDRVKQAASGPVIEEDFIDAPPTTPSK